MLKVFDKKSSIDYIIVGLGNPGIKYEGCRHNIGFSAIDYIAEQRNFKVSKIEFKSLTGKCDINGKKVLFMKPQTFMNLSGQAVSEAVNFYKVPITHVFVIVDDIDIEPGMLRIRKNGSAGGHNGLKNIIYLCNSDQFPRLRVGVGSKPHPDYDLADWVLAHPDKENMKKIEGAIERVNLALDFMVDDKIDLAMSRYNG